MPVTYDENGALTFCIPSQDGINLITYDYHLSALAGADNIAGVSNSNCVAGNNFNGCFIQTGKGKFGILLGGRESQSIVFRGQNKIYEKFIPSAKRLQVETDKCIEYIKKQEFLDLFKRTPYYSRCRKFRVLDCVYDFDFEALAQHYGFISDYIDITRNLNIALFFAYCKYNGDGLYEPILDFSGYDPVLYVSNVYWIHKDSLGKIKIIGFQAALRPLKQCAMALDVRNDDDFIKYFNCYHLPKDPEISNYIYNTMNGGKFIFPDDIVSKLAKNVMENKQLQEKFFDEWCSTNAKFDRDEVSKAILNLGYTFTDKIFDIDKGFYDIINSEIDNGIIPFLETIGYRRTSPMFHG